MTTINGMAILLVPLMLRAFSAGPASRLWVRKLGSSRSRNWPRPSGLFAGDAVRLPGVRAGRPVLEGGEPPGFRVAEGRARPYLNVPGDRFGRGAGAGVRGTGCEGALAGLVGEDDLATGNAEAERSGTERGFRPGGQASQFSLWTANVVVSLLFAGLHADQWPAPVPLFLLSLVLGWLYLRTGGLAAPGRFIRLSTG